MIGLAGGAVVLVVGAVVLFLVLRNHATPISVAQALRNYHNDRSTPLASGLLPVPGVYVYLTRGSEQLSVPGTSRSYPTQTTMTVVAAKGCGVNVRWDALAEHVEENRECLGPDGSLSLASSAVSETFFGIVSRSTVDCGPGAYLRPPHPARGEDWHFECGGSGQTWRGDGRVVAIEPIRVGRSRITAVDARLDISYSGAQSGENPSDYWFALSNALLVRWTGTVSVSQGSSPLGAVRYREQYDLNLSTTTPRR